MTSTDIPAERLDNLAVEAVETVFLSMVDESVEFRQRACLLTQAEGDMIRRPALIGGGFFTIAVSFIGDANGKVMLSLPNAAAERFALRLFDAPSLDWVGDDPQETLRDTMGELGNMLVGLVKGGLTKWFPVLMLQTPKVLENRRLKVDNAKVSFRKQYLFEGLGAEILIDFSCE